MGTSLNQDEGCRSGNNMANDKDYFVLNGKGRKKITPVISAGLNKGLSEVPQTEI
jgi:hypothetical protein